MGTGSHLTLSTQAAERAYRAAEGTARVTTGISVAEDASLFWVPQELILFDGASLTRRLHIDLASSARLLMVEPVIFGRKAMGETLRDAALNDRIEICRDGTPVYIDGVKLAGDLEARLSRAALAAGAGAMASLVMVAPEAEAHLPHLQAALPDTAGASLLAADILALRMVAEDGFALRRVLLPILDRLSRDRLPRTWRL